MGGRLPVATVRDAAATAGAFPTTIAAADTATAAAAMPTTSRRSSGHGMLRRNGRARQTSASEPSSATFAAYSVVVGAISTPARRPSETAYAIRPVGER